MHGQTGMSNFMAAFQCCAGVLAHAAEQAYLAPHSVQLSAISLACLITIGLVRTGVRHTSLYTLAVDQG